MKIIIAPDKFKKSLTGMQFCAAVEEGIKEILPNTEIIKLPLADGGDGTIEVVSYYLKGSAVKIKVNGPFFEPVIATYLYSESSKTAFIEMAEASGVKLLNHEQLDCKNATTLGTGEMIVHAMDKGATKIILGIGGSATNDCGIGMAIALGYRFLDKNNQKVKPIGANLSSITSIDVSHVHPKINEVKFNIACDVSNPLYGKNGAAYIYGAQKGASKRDILMLDKGLEDISEILKEVFGVNSQMVKGAGAAGGMGIASKVFLNGALESGIQVVKNLADFDNQIEDADWIITGEGKLDLQTLSGKTIYGVLSSAKKKDIKVAAFCGTVDLNADSTKEFGIDYIDMVDNYAKNLKDAMTNGYDHVKKIANVFASQVLK